MCDFWELVGRISFFFFFTAMGWKWNQNILADFFLALLNSTIVLNNVLLVL